MNKSDNPVQKEIDRLFGGESTPGTTDYLYKLKTLQANLTGQNIDKISYLLKATDPYGILRSGNRFKVLSGEQSFAEIGNLLHPRAAGALSALARTSPSLSIYRDGNEIYLGSHHAGFVPLPKQSKSGGLADNLVHVAGKSRGAYKATFLGQDGNVVRKTYTDLFYETFESKVMGLLGTRRSLPRPIAGGSPIVLFDLETTGAMNAAGHLDLTARQEVVQFSAIKIHGRKLERMNIYIKPNGAIEYGGHGLTSERLEKLGARSLQDAAPEIARFMQGAVTSGYNVKGFDIPVLQANLARAGIAMDLSQHGVIDVMDLHRAATGQFGGTLSSAFGMVTGRRMSNAHNAAADVAATLKILRHYTGAGIDGDQIARGANAAMMSGHSELSAHEAIRQLRTINNTVIGVGPRAGKGRIALSELLGTGAIIKGMATNALTAAYVGLQSVVMQLPGSGPLHRVFQDRVKAAEARRVISQVAKSRGKSVPDMPWLESLQFNGKKLTASQALAAAYKVYDDYTGVRLPAMYDALGIPGQSPLSKPDSLVEAGSNLIVSTPEAGALFGNAFSQRMMFKGASQYYTSSPITLRQANNWTGMGRNPVRNYMSLGESKLGAHTLSSDFVGSSLPMRVLVMDTPHELATRLLTQDSGSLLTNRGAKALAMGQGFGQLTYKGANERIFQAFETLTGADPFSLTPEATDFSLNRREFSRATNKYIKRKRLSAREKAIRTLAMYRNSSGELVKRESYGALNLLARGNLPAGRARAYRSGGKFVINLFSDLASSASVGMVAAGVRITGTGVRTSHTFAAEARQAKYDYMITRDVFRKMDTGDVLMENFMGIAKQHKLHLTFPDQMARIGTGSRAQDVRIALGVVKLLRGRGGKFAQVADKIISKRSATRRGIERLGKRVNLPGGGTGTLLTVPTILRGNQRLDVNIQKKIKLTLGKFKTLAFGTGMLGYSDPFQDPIFNFFSQQFSRFGVSWDPKKMDLDLTDNHPVKRFVAGIVTPGFTPDSSQVIRMMNGQMHLGDTPLVNLPSINDFSVKTGGVDRAALKGTLLDPSLGDMFYLDLGKERNLGLFGGKVLSGIDHRYIPVPRSIMRLDKSVDGGVTVQKSHPAYRMLSALIDFQNTGKASRKNLRHAIQNIFSKLGGKTGILNKSSIAHISSGFHARLIPQQTGMFTPENFSSPRKVFEAGVSRRQVINSLLMRQGSMPEAQFAELMGQAKTKSHMYGIFGVDPMQRLEHASMTKFKLIDDALVSSNLAEYGMDVQAHPLQFLSTERDTDLDPARITFLERKNIKQYKDRIRRQAKGIAPIVGYFRNILSTPDKGVKVSKELAGDLMTAYVGQKSFASLGYSQVRPTLERLMPIIASEGAEGLITRKLAFTEGPLALTMQEIHGINKIFAGSGMAAEEISGAFNLSQYLFQSGVGKGTSKDAQRGLVTSLIALSEMGGSGKEINIDEALRIGTNAFDEFLRVSDKNRMFQSAALLEKSTPKVLEGLMAGVEDNSEAILRRRAAILMSATIGLGYAVAAKVKNNYTLSAFVEDQLHDTDGSSLFKRVFGPVAGVFGLESGVGEEVDDTIKVPSKLSAFSEEWTRFRASKHFKPAMIAAGAVAAIGLYNSATAPDFSSPISPMSDTSRPRDMGPSTPNFSNTARINTSRFTPSASSSKNYQGFNPVNSNIFDSSSNSRTIVDNRSFARQNSWLSRRQMDIDAESQF
jgi:DNA polymerase III epsilon subunit-like protein